jgi:diacylglycerol kinase family enzyme
MMLAPGALLDDGRLDIVAIEQVGRLRFLANLPKVFSGAHVELPSVGVYRAAEVSISADRPFTMYADGDPIGELPVRVRALPGAVTVLVPDSVAAGGVLGSPQSPGSPRSAAAPIETSSSSVVQEPTLNPRHEGP